MRTASPTSRKPADLSGWPTKEQAAEMIGISTKTLEQMAQAGDIQQAMYRRPTGGPRIRVYHPEDVKRIAKQRNPDAGPLLEHPESGEREQPSPAEIERKAKIFHDQSSALDRIVGNIRASSSPENSQRQILPVSELAKTLHIDDNLLREAKAACGAATDTETIRVALEGLIRHAAYQRLRCLLGTEPDARDVPRRREGAL